jgi:SAM-dependent methyltransferase
MATSTYVFENAMVEGRRRLALLERWLDSATLRRLDAIGVGAGWRCLELGAGGGSVCERLCERVGSTGRVCAIDIDTRFVRGLGYANLEVREENVLEAILPESGFDLVHSRWTLLHIPQRELVLEKLVAALRPGGTLFLEEADGHPVRTLDRTPWRDLCQRVFDIVKSRGSNPDWAHELPYKMAALGLGNVRAEAETPYFHGRSELAEFWRISWEVVRDGVAAAGADVSQWDRELAALDDPSLLFIGPMTVSVIATKSEPVA